LVGIKTEQSGLYLSDLSSECTMLHRRSDRLSWLIGRVCRFAATLLAVAVIAGPALPAAAAYPTFSVGLSRSTALPGDVVTATFSTPDIGVVITSCSAWFDGWAAVDCSPGGTSVQLSVPNDAKPGSTLVQWGLSYSYNDPDGTVRGTQRGTLPFTVLAPSPSQTEPTFAVELSRNTALPGEVVTVTFSSPDTGVVITSCSAGFDGRAAVDCPPGGTSVQLSVPNDARPGSTSILWGLSYRYNDLDGTVRDYQTFTVLAPSPSPSSSPSPSPTFAVELSRSTALPGEVVTVTFSSPDAGVVITSCSAGFDGRAAVACPPGGTSVQLSVPNDAKPGSTSVRWSLSYTYDDPDGPVRGDQNGTLPFTVPPPSPSPSPSRSLSPTQPTFSVDLSRSTALPGEVVTVTFSSRDRGVVITACSARFSDRAAVACRRGETSVRLLVPNDAPAGANSVNWTLSYKERTAGAGRNAVGRLSLTVLAPTPSPDPASHSRTLEVGLLVVALFVVLGTALTFLRRRSRGQTGGRPDPVQAGQSVRAAAHAGPEPRVTIRDSEPGRSRFVRFDRHSPAAISEIEEVRR
jgi:hypothetical protein